MRTKRTAIVVVVACLLSFKAHDALGFYNSSTGRWLSRDPIGERGGANLYGFAKNNGINKGDSLGKCVAKTGGNPRLGQGFRFEFAGATTDVTVDVPDKDLCNMDEIDVVFSFRTDFYDTLELNLQEDAEFTCNGTKTGFSDFGTAPDSSGAKQWKVTCRLKTTKCNSTATGVTMGMSGRKDMGQPLIGVGTVNASINYTCDCPCKIRGCIDMRLSATGAK
jgi:hypothetical protein